MVYRGHVEKGIVVFDDPVNLPDGAEVRIELSKDTPVAPLPEGEEETLGQKLLKHAGKAVGLPSDFAVQHDHYLYGTPKE